MNCREKWAREYRESQDCPSTWDGDSLQRGYQAGFDAGIEKAAKFIEQFVRAIGTGTLLDEETHAVFGKESQ